MIKQNIITQIYTILIYVQVQIYTRSHCVYDSLTKVKIPPYSSCYFTNAKPYWVISASQQQVKKRWVSASAKYFLSGKKNLVADSENLTVCIEKVKFFCRDNNCPVTLKHSVYVNTDNVIEITAKDF